MQGKACVAAWLHYAAGSRVRAKLTCLVSRQHAGAQTAGGVPEHKVANAACQGICTKSGAEDRGMHAF